MHVANLGRETRWARILVVTSGSQAQVPGFLWELSFELLGSF